MERETSTLPLALACCPSCNRSLLDSSSHSRSHVSVRITGCFGDDHGWVRFSLSPGQGATVESEHAMPAAGPLDFFCPHCHAELTGALRCARCGAPMVRLLVPLKGVLQICGRGCSHVVEWSCEPPAPEYRVCQSCLRFRN
jgi:hypothetical protein